MGVQAGRVRQSGYFLWLIVKVPFSARHRWRWVAFCAQGRAEEVAEQLFHQPGQSDEVFGVREAPGGFPKADGGGGNPQRNGR